MKKIFQAAFVVAFFNSIFSLNTEMKAEQYFPKPDFAYPEKVISQTEEDLKKSLDDKDYISCLRYAMNLCIADQEKSKNTIEKNCNLLDSLSKVVPSPFSEFSSLIEATFIRNYYRDNRWRYSDRVLPLEQPWPDKMSEWSGEMFADTIYNLIDKGYEGLLQGIHFNKFKQFDSSDKFDELFTFDDGDSNEEVQKRFHYTIYDRFILIAIDNLSPFTENNVPSVIPFYRDKDLNMKNPYEKCSFLINRLYDDFISYNEREDNSVLCALGITKKAATISDIKEKENFINLWKDKLKGSEGYGILLCYIWNNRFPEEINDETFEKEFYSQVVDWLEKYKNSPFYDEIFNIKNTIETKKTELDIPNMLLPQEKWTAGINMYNMNSAYLLIFPVSASNVDRYGHINNEKLISFEKPLHVIPLETEGEIPFRKKIEVDMPSLQEGYYVVVPSSSKDNYKSSKAKGSYNNYSVVNVTDISIITLNDYTKKNSGELYVVNSKTQEPIAGATVCFYEEGRGNKLLSKKVTNKAGFVSAPQNYCWIDVSYNKSSLKTTGNFWYSSPSKLESDNVKILTDLSVYKPGDKLEFSAICWKSDREGNRLSTFEDITVYLNDVNGQRVDSVSLKTDNYGRARGELKIPADGLLGTYSLYTGKNNRYEGYTPIEVAEYKQPGFQVIISGKQDSSYQPGDLVKFTGEVMTYSGMPVGGAEINYKIKFNPWRYWGLFRANDAYYSNILTSSPDGKFVIELPTDNLKNTIYENGCFVLEVSATSPSGETQSSPAMRFCIGNAYTIVPDFKDKIMITDSSLDLKIGVQDMFGTAVKKEVGYKLFNSEKEIVKEGLFISPLLTCGTENLPSGKYIFEFTIPDEDNKVEKEVVLYRTDDKKAPYQTSLWLPENKIIAGKNDSTVNIKFGCGYADNWVLYVITTSAGEIEKKWVKMDGYNKEINVKAPEGFERVWITFSGLHDLQQESDVVTIINEVSLEKLDLEVVSFRDRLSSGMNEKWKFKFNKSGVAMGDMPVFAVLTDKAINAIFPFEWNFVPYRFIPERTMNLSGRSSTEQTYTRYFSDFSDRRYKYINLIPSLQFYGYPHSEIFTALQAKSSMNYSRGITNAMYDMAVKEEAAEDVVEFESQVAEAGGISENSPKDDIELRPIEMPVVFFRSDLVTDAQGDVEVEFEVPDFNTTWQFQLLGYDSELLTAKTILDAVSAKPVMAQGNFPLYLRTGDKASVSALLFNNSTDSLSVGGRIEIMNSSDGSILFSSDFEGKWLKPTENRLVTIDFDVPSDVMALEMRVYAFSGNFTDGEKVNVPVYPASTPVIESTQFYIGSSSDSARIKLPHYNKNANVTLKYCDNPLWECMLALPSISVPESKSSLSIVKALYAGSVALRISQDYPYIENNLKRMFSQDSLYELESHLNEDSELKVVGLNETPWVNNARSEKIRMEQLYTLLNPRKANNKLDRLVNQLKNLQNSDGGWSWCEGMKSSLFITEEVILEFGEMKRACALPSSCDALIKKGIDYCDRTIYQDYKKYGYLSLASMLEYLYTRSFFNVPFKNKEFEKLALEFTEKIKDEWKTLSIREKAEAAILFFRTKGYGQYSSEVLESLVQYAMKSESRGWYFDNISSGFDGWGSLLTTSMVLNAFAEIKPDAEAVDGFRQWLLLQKETEDWGSRDLTVQVIQSILASGTDWDSVSGIPEIMVDGDFIQLPSDYEGQGILTLNLDPIRISGKTLEIKKGGNAPSWGGVVSQFVQPIQEVKPENCLNLSIRKQVLAIEEGSDGIYAKEGELKVGDKVRITLTINCEKDMDYVAIVDNRGACIQPDEWLSGYGLCGELWGYRETRDDKTSLFFEFVPKGVHVITYDCHIDRAGKYSTGIATVQSQYAPQNVAHSAGQVIHVF